MGKMKEYYYNELYEKEYAEDFDGELNYDDFDDDENDDTMIDENY